MMRIRAKVSAMAAAVMSGLFGAGAALPSPKKTSSKRKQVAPKLALPGGGEVHPYFRHRGTAGYGYRCKRGICECGVMNTRVVESAVKVCACRECGAKCSITDRNPKPWLRRRKK